VTKASHPFLRNLGATIKSLRAQRRLSQEALADLAAIDRSYMSGIERGLRNISVLHAARIASALDISLPDLLRLHGADGRLGSRLAADDVQAAVEELTESLRRHRAEAAVPPIVDVDDTTREWELGRYLSLG
jgi:transcriptional regulator with XRE-family HTH domain